MSSKQALRNRVAVEILRYNVVKDLDGEIRYYDGVPCFANEVSFHDTWGDAERVVYALKERDAPFLVAMQQDMDGFLVTVSYSLKEMEFHSFQAHDEQYPIALYKAALAALDAYAKEDYL